MASISAMITTGETKTGITTRAISVPRTGTQSTHQPFRPNDGLIKHVRWYAIGGLDVLTYGNVQLPALKPNELLVQVAFAGLNFIDSNIINTFLP